MNSSKYVVKFPLTLGLAIRKSVIRSLREYCLLTKCEISIEEDKGLLDSYYEITIRGDRKPLEHLLRQLNEMFGEES